MKKLLLSISLLFCLTATGCASSPENPDTTPEHIPGLFGVNLAGAEFDQNTGEGEGRLNIDYHYPTPIELDYWHSKGLNLIRLPFKWDRIQREAGGSLSADEVDYIKYLLQEADARGMKIILDMHNYCRRNYEGEVRVIGDRLTPQHFGQFWAEMARNLKDQPAIYGYGLCNEPHDMLLSCPWTRIAQVAIDSIRSVDMENTIIVGGDSWSSSERWQKMNYGLEALVDPADNLMYEAHCYFDSDGSGTYRYDYDREGVYPNIGVERAKPFVEWLKQNGKRGFLGEYGVPEDDPRWLVCLDLFLDYLAENGVGGTYWSAGAHWGDYILSIQPRDNFTKDRPQLEILTKYPRTK